MEMFNLSGRSLMTSNVISFSKKILHKIELTTKKMDIQLNLLGVSFKQHKKYFILKKLVCKF